MSTVPLKPVTADFVLADVDTSSHPGVDKKSAEKELLSNHDTLADLQHEQHTAGSAELALGEQTLLQVGGIDPQGVHIHAFKAPTEEERKHDFLWRVRPQLPTPGIIGVFDRSHYEDVLIHRVRGFSTPEAIEERYGIITDFESEVAAAGTAIIKVMLHISSAEQKARLSQRLDRADKNWKYNPGDVDERKLWPAYQEAYQIALTRTSTPDAPWYVVPADNKWYARWAVQGLLLDALQKLDPQWPSVDYDVEAEKARLAAT